jgi:hypothetical protein
VVMAVKYSCDLGRKHYSSVVHPGSTCRGVRGTHTAQRNQAAGPLTFQKNQFPLANAAQEPVRLLSALPFPDAQTPAANLAGLPQGHST